MHPGQPRQRQDDFTLVVAIDQTVCPFGRGRPVDAEYRQRNIDFRGAVLDYRQRAGLLRPDDTRYTRLQNTGLLERNLLDRVAEELHMVQRYRCDNRDSRRRDNIGRIESPAQTGLQQQ